MNCKVVNRLVDMKIAPSKLSTPSAIFLPVQFKFSDERACLVNGGDQFLASGSFVRINLLSFKFLPILYKNIFVTNASFSLATLDSPARSSACKRSYANNVAANFKIVSPYVSKVS
jgi:hypothetical protein